MNNVTLPEVQQTIEKLYRDARDGLDEGIPIVLLQITARYTIAASGCEEMPDQVQMFSIGAEKTAEEYFKHTPPTPAEMENAIMAVEEEVMPMKKLFPSDSRLFTFDARIQEIASYAEGVELAAETTLLRSKMEDVFSRLAAIITGRPASMDTLPSDLPFAATLLILREFMHHLGFVDIVIKNNL